MCGIVGYTGAKKSCEIIIEGLKKLEYRGYDSAGVSLHEGGDLKTFKSKGELAFLENLVSDQTFSGTSGIGHTRWATHGRPSDENSHPHTSCCGKFAVVHNGIIENYRQLREELEKDGHTFISETDTEVLPHLIENNYNGDLKEAVDKTVARLEGSYALVAVCSNEQGRLICARKDSPLVIGIGEGENIIASDIPALLSHTRKVYILEDGETASVTPEAVEIFNSQNELIHKEILNVEWDAVLAEKGGYPHFMLKEIMEQPTAVKETLRGRLNSETGFVELPELNLTVDEIKNINGIHIVACGTAYHAGVVAKYLFEKLLKIKTNVDLASEFRYRDPIISPDELVIVISQSGETADTLAALRLARSKGAKILAVTNVVGSSVSREAHEVIYTWAGPEIAVASTKAYMTQLIALYMLALKLGKDRDTLDDKEHSELGKHLAQLPEKITALLAEENLEKYRSYSKYLAKWENAFYIGRNLDFAVAMEGSLKLKEISYIHAEAYPAGELKHGSLALITDGLPVVALATQADILDKTISNVQEIKARDGHILIVAPEGTERVEDHADTAIYLPTTHNLFAPVLAVLPLQLISYYTAHELNCPIDKPRNLAKSVTVE